MDYKVVVTLEKGCGNNLEELIEKLIIQFHTQTLTELC